MVQRNNRLGLALEPATAFGPEIDVAREHFDGDQAVQPRVAGATWADGENAEPENPGGPLPTARPALCLAESPGPQVVGTEGM
jgi:hypothetical protein